MNAWLGPISLRLVERGPSLGGPRVRSEDIRQPEAFLGQATLRSSYDLGRPVHPNLGQEPKCCNAPDGTTKCYDHTDGVCQNTWNSGAPTPGAPPCIQDSRGEWVHPDCRYSPPPPTARLAGRVRQLPLVVVNFGPMPGRSHMMGDTAPAQQKLIACVNGPDLYDIYNPDMSLVAKAVLNPAASYPNAQVEIAKFPPCPVPQATGAGGLCDLPLGRSMVGCWNPKKGWTLFDATTGAPLGTNISGACISLIKDFTEAPPGDSRCAGASAPSGGGQGTTPSGGGQGTTPSGGGDQGTAPSGGGNQGTTPPIGGDQGTTPSGGGDQGTFPISNVDGVSAASGGQVMPGSEPIPATGIPVLPPAQQMTTASPPTGAFPGQPFAAAPMANKPVPIAKAPAPLPPTCPLGPVPLRQWAEGCMGK
jgi:hypothetical protein